MYSASTHMVALEKIRCAPLSDDLNQRKFIAVFGNEDARSGEAESGDGWELTLFDRFYVNTIAIYLPEHVKSSIKSRGQCFSMQVVINKRFLLNLEKRFFCYRSTFSFSEKNEKTNLNSEK